MVQLDYSGLQRITYWQCMEEMEPQMEALMLGSADNTEPTKDGLHIPLELIGEWAESDYDPFPTYDQVKAYAQKDKQIWKTLCSNIRNDDYPRVITTYQWPINSETTLEIMLKTHFDIVNLALEVTAMNNRHVTIAGGKSATAGDSERNITSQPDRASFIMPTELDGNALIYCLTQLDSKNAKNLANILPGEIKLWYKFRREFKDATMTNKNGRNVPDWEKRKQAQQVFTQIYQYMNERDSAIGYLITDQELICVRRIRKERYGMRYGVMDISPGIPLSIEKGHLNAKMALWYLHHKYTVMHPKSYWLPRTEKPKNWKFFLGSIKLLRAAAESSIDVTSQRRTRARTNTPELPLEIRETFYDDEGPPFKPGPVKRTNPRRRT